MPRSHMAAKQAHFGTVEGRRSKTTQSGGHLGVLTECCLRRPSRHSEVIQRFLSLDTKKWRSCAHVFSAGGRKRAALMNQAFKLVRMRPMVDG